MATSQDFEQRRISLFDKYAAGEIDKATYDTLSAELLALEAAAGKRPQQRRAARPFLWCTGAAVIVVGSVTALWHWSDPKDAKEARNFGSPPQSETSTRQIAGPPGVPSDDSAATSPSARLPVNTTPPPPADSAGGYPGKQADRPKSPESVDSTPSPPPNSNASAAPQPVPSDAPFVPQRRLEYRWEPDKSYTYYVHVETERGNLLTTENGCAIYAAQRATPPKGKETDGKRTGTAFVVHPDGYLLTCAHCVEDAVSFEIALGGRVFPATVVSTDEANDLALIRVDAKNLVALPLADSDRIAVGEDVRAIGFPLSSILGDTIKATRGTISGIDTQDNMTVIQIDASLNAGNSGGPLLRETGEVIGVNFAKITGEATTSIGLAVPINYARQLLTRQGLTAVTAVKAAPQKLDGPALIKRASESVGLLTVKESAGSHCVGLALRVNSARAARKATDPPADLTQMPGFRESLEKTFDVGLFIVDSRGRILDAKIQPNIPKNAPQFLILEPLPGQWKRQWKETEVSSVTFHQQQTVVESRDRIDEPGIGIELPPWPNGLGPEMARRRPRLPDWGHGPRNGAPIRSIEPFDPFDPFRRNRPPETRSSHTTTKEITVPAVWESTYHAADSAGEKVLITKREKLETRGSPDQPRLESTGTGKITFDPNRGIILAADIQTDTVTTYEDAKESESQRVTMRLVEGDELESFKRPLEMSQEEWDRVIAELKTEVKLQTLARLSKVQPRDDRRADLLAALEKACDHGDLSVRLLVFQVLDAWGTGKEFAIWAKLLSDREQSIRQMALNRVKSMQDETIADAIARHCMASLFTRRVAAQRLKEMGPTAEKAVIGLLGHPDHGVTAEACDILKEIGTSECLPALVKLAETVDDHAADRLKAAVTAVCARTGQDTPQLPVRPRSKPASLARSDQSSGDTQDAERSIGQIIVDLKSSDERVRHRTLEWLARHEPSEQPPAELVTILEDLLQSNSDGLRRDVVKALGVWGSADVVPKLIPLLIDRDIWIHQPAIDALLRFRQDERVAEALADRIAVFGGRREAADALKKIGPPAEKHVLKQLQHKDAGVRRTACDILKSVGTEASISALEKLAENDRFSNGPATEAIREIRKRAADERNPS